MRERVGAPCPPIIETESVEELFSRYISEMVGKKFEDPRKTAICFFEENFPKLIQLEVKDPRTGEFKKASADLVVKERKIDLSGGEYRNDRGRAKRLLWLPEIITDPDSIHDNTHPVVIGEEVYVKRYATTKDEEYKLVFTTRRPSGVRVATTSFGVRESRLRKFVVMPPKWEKEKAAS